MQLADLRVNLSLDNDKFKVTIRDTEQVLRSFEGRVNDTAKSVKNIEGAMTGWGNSLGRTIQTLGMARFALLDIRDIFLSLPIAIIKTSGEIEKMKVLMEGLSTESTEAARKMEALNSVKFAINLAQNAPFELKALTDAMVKFKTGGIDPTNGSLAALTNSIAAFGGNGESLKRASIAIQQMSGKGVISMEELRQQLGEAVPTAMAAMARGMNMSMSELADAIQKGTVRSEGALKKMLVVMGIENMGASRRMMGTWVGMLEQLKTRWEMFKLDMGGEGLFEGAKAELKLLLDAMKGEESGTLARAIGRGLNDAATSIIKLTKTIFELWEYIVMAGKAFMFYFAASKIAPMIAGIANAVTVAQGGLAALYASNLMQQRNLQTAREVGLQQAIDADKKKIDSNKEVIRSEQEITRKTREESLARVRNEIATNEAIMGVNRQRVTEHRAIQQQIATSSAMAIANAGGRLTPDQDLEVQSLIRREEAARKAAQQAEEHNKKLQSQTAILRQNSQELRTSSGLMTEKARLAAAENVLLGQSIAAHTAKARAVEGVSRAYAAVSAATGAVLGGIKSMLFSMNGLILVIMAAAYAWDYFSSKAKKAAAESATAAAMAAKLKAGQAQQEDVDAANGEATRILEGQRDNRKVLQGLENKERIMGTMGQKLRPSDQKLLDDARAKDQAFIAALEKNRAEAVEGMAQVAKKSGASLGAGMAAEATARVEAAMEAEQAKLKTMNDELTKLRTGTAKEVNSPATKKRDAALVKQIEDADVNFLLQQQTGLRREAAEIKKTIDAGNVARKDYFAATEAYKELNKQADALNGQIQTRRAPKDTIIAPKEKKGGAKGPTPTDVLGNSIEQSLRSIQKAKAAMQNVAEGVVEVSDLMLQAEEEIALMLSQAPEQDISRSGNQSEKIKRAVEELTVKKVTEMALAETRQVAPKVRELTELNKQLEQQIASGNVGATRLSNEERVLAAYRSLKTRLKIENTEFDELIKQQAELIRQAALRDINTNILQNREQLSQQRVDLIQNERERTRVINEKILSDTEQQNAREMAQAIAQNSGIEELAEQHARKVRNIREKMLQDSETPIDALARSWTKNMNDMDQATARFADNGIDAIVDFARTGKFEIGKFVEGMLADILKMQLQNALAAPLKQFGPQFSQLLGGIVGAAPDPGKAAGDAGLGAVAQAGREVAKSFDNVAGATGKAVVQAGEEAVQNASAATTHSVYEAQIQVTTLSLSALASAAASAAASMGGAALSPFANAALGALGGIVGAPAAAAGGAQTFAVPTPNVQVTPILNANGNVMTEFGPLALQKYANGGIARSPQLAIFGEGSMAEAYVPLPDGRSIPVTMSGGNAGGGGAPNVTVNVINQSGQNVNADQKSVKFDGKQMILDVVISAASQPGPFRNAIKGVR